LVRNACVAAGNAAAALNPQQCAQLRARLAPLAASDDPTLADHARWALARLA
jgi:epoxyqueuosine reductase QueG